jgi:hypothetical protein
MNHRRVWFDRGWKAFKSSFPEAAQRVPWDRFYVCPLCLAAFSERSLNKTVAPPERLTDEHVPPKRIGGKKMLLTCGGCNSGGGSAVDSHMSRETDAHAFFKGNLKEVKARLATASGQVPIRLSRSESGIQVFGVPKAVKPEIHRGVIGDFEKTAIEGSSLRFEIELPPYSHARAATSWLRTAYLAFFSALGYRFICRRELDVVRERIKNPEQQNPATFRIIRPEQSEPLLIRIEAPEVFKSYVLFHGHNVVFLPRYNDDTLYQRLAEHPETKVNFEGKQYPWPVGGPTFWHDHAAPPPS